MDIYAQLTVRIIQGQEEIIGPIALEQALKVPGLTVHWENKEVELLGDEKTIVDNLIVQYRSLFGDASVRVCKEAVLDLIRDIPQGEVPSLLA